MNTYSCPPIHAYSMVYYNVAPSQIQKDKTDKPFQVEPKVITEWLDPRVKVCNLPKPVKAKPVKALHVNWKKHIQFRTVGYQYTVKSPSHSYTGQIW